jgi:hypothetical protein
VVVVVAGIHEGIARQAENLLMNGTIQHRDIAALKIGAPASLDQERVSREKHRRLAVAKEVAVVAGCVPRRVQRQ